MGTIKERECTAADLCDPSWKKPSDVPKNLTDMVAQAPTTKGKKTN